MTKASDSSSAISTFSLGKSFCTYDKAAGFLGTLKSFVNRKYKITQALENFNLEISNRELVGLLGANGAGKTTLIKMLTGIIVPSSGEISVLGYKPHERSVGFCKSIALVLGNKSQLWWDLPAYDSLRVLQKYYEVPDNLFTQRVNDLSERLKVVKLLHRNIRTLSLGERMKMELLACLLHSPSIIFLDEPTIGLDVDAQINIRNFLLEYHRDNNCTILITSHYMADIEALCQRIVFVHGGQKCFDGKLSHFAGLLGDQRAVKFYFASKVDSKLPLWQEYSAQFSLDDTAVDLLIPLDQVGAVTSKVMSQFVVTDLQVDKQPIERVVSKVINNPNLLTQPQ